MLDKLNNLICEYVDIDINIIKGETRFVEDLGFNSYDYMSFVGEVEEVFNIVVNEQDIINVRTISDMIKYIRDHKIT